MIKKLTLIFALLCIGVFSYAQMNPRTIGLRLGGGSYSGAEVTYQQTMGDANRLELDLGFGASKVHSRLYLAGIYHWNWNLASNLNWYIGPGASIGYWTWDGFDPYINLGIGGQIGIEYDLKAKDFPFLLSLDVRPMWDLFGDNAGVGYGMALGIRYIWN